jgi:hypothetical protein
MENNSRVMHKNLCSTCYLSISCPSTLSSINAKQHPVQYEHNVYTTNYNKEEYRKNSMKKGYSNDKYHELVYKRSISQARELQEYDDNMKSIREQREYQEPSMKLLMAKKYQDSTMYKTAVEEDVS